MKPSRWVNLIAIIATFACFWFLFSQFFWREMTTTRIGLLIVGMIIELALCVANSYILIRGEIRYRKDLKRLKEIEKENSNGTK